MRKTSSSDSKKDAKVTNGVDQSLDEALISKAVAALLKYHSKQSESSGKEQLFGTDAAIHVQFNMEVAPARHNPKPLRLTIPNEIHKLNQGGSDADDSNDIDDSNLEEPEVCLIVKDDAKPWLQEMIEKFPNQMGFVKKVLTLSSLRSKHAQYKQRRELSAKYSCFMADDRILPMLHKALGSQFFDAKKQPIPLRITRREALPHLIQRALSATYMTLNAGACVTVKTGFTHMEPEKLVENILSIASGAAERIPRGWANIRSIGIKTPTSTMLPIYNKTPEELDEIAKLAGLNPVYVKEDEMSKKEEKASKKKKRENGDDAIKSPLVMALKKQKLLDKKEDEVEEEQTGSSSKKSKAQSATEEEEADELKEGEKAKDKKEKKKEKKEKKKSKRSAEDEDKSVKSEASSSPSPKKKVKKGEDESSTKKTKKAKSADDALKSNFIPSKKFTGSKQGFIYQKSVKGLGYYKDVKPVIDKQKVDAILRACKGGNRGGKRRGRR